LFTRIGICVARVVIRVLVVIAVTITFEIGRKKYI
jgi:hypothetical protein